MKITRRHFIQLSGTAAVEGAYDNAWGLPANSRMTPAQGAAYLGIPNVIMDWCDTGKSWAGAFTQ
jgi:hypothetical protein